MNNSFNILQKRLNPPLIVLGMILAIYLSGCIQPQEQPPSPSFIPEQAVFYNPITNKTGSLSVTNLDGQNYSFRDQNRIEILVGLKDSQETPGVNYSLILMFNFTRAGREVTHNLTEQLKLPLITNNSGIAHIIFIYDQYSWPPAISQGKGQLLILCWQLPNVTASSDIGTFYYYHKEIYRNTTMKGGLDAINTLENRNIIEEAISLGGNESTYLNWNSFFHDFRYVIINTSTIDYFSALLDAHDITFQYEAWAIDHEGSNLTYSQLTTICTEYWGMYFPVIVEDYLAEDWLISAPLSQINTSDNWLILQRLLYESYTHDMAGWVLHLYQLAILGPDFSLHWLISSTELIMA